jgi:hypothetical protein
LPEQRKQSQIWSHLRPERRYPEQFLLIFTVLPKGSEGNRRPTYSPWNAVTILSKQMVANLVAFMASKATVGLFS